MLITLLILGCGGFASGILAGLLGIGGGVLLVPILVSLGYTPVQSVATSSLAILATSMSGSFQNLRTGDLDPRRVLHLGIPSLFTAHLGVYAASRFHPSLLLFLFALLLLANIYLVQLRKKLSERVDLKEAGKIPKTIYRLVTGGSAGLLAGLFGIGGGIVMVPLQMLLLNEPIKIAIRTSLGVIVITAISACIGHAAIGNILLWQGLSLGCGGLIGAQISTRILPKLDDSTVSLLLRCFFGVMAIYMFWRSLVSLY